MLELEPIVLTKIVARSHALDLLVGESSPDVFYFRVAPDELLADDVEDLSWYALTDPDAIVERDASFSRAIIDWGRDANSLVAQLEWKFNLRNFDDESEPETEYSRTGQGLLHQVPVKLWFDEEAVQLILLCSSAHAHELQERLQ